MAHTKTTSRRVARRAERRHSELRKASLLTQAEELSGRAVREFARQVASLLDSLPIATKREVVRIERQIARLTRKLRELEKGGSP